MTLSKIKRIGIGYYELENGQLVDKGLYHLAAFLARPITKLDLIIKGKRYEKL